MIEIQPGVNVELPPAHIWLNRQALTIHAARAAADRWNLDMRNQSTGFQEMQELAEDIAREEHPEWQEEVAQARESLETERHAEQMAEALDEEVDRVRTARIAARPTPPPWLDRENEIDDDPNPFGHEVNDPDSEYTDSDLMFQDEGLGLV